MTQKQTTDYAAHIDRLLLEHGIEAEWTVPGRTQWGARKRRKVRILPVTTQHRYATALHEIGHVIGPRQTGRRIEQEWGAWEYALSTSIVPFSVATHRYMLRCLRAYTARYIRWASGYVPPADSAFWRFVDDIAAEADQLSESPARWLPRTMQRGQHSA